MKKLADLTIDEKKAIADDLTNLYVALAKSYIEEMGIRELRGIIGQMNHFVHENNQEKFQRLCDDFVKKENYMEGMISCFQSIINNYYKIRELLEQNG